uniref:CASP-like protein n=1 Tax=Oryza glaberrima TaxID=4538 RepID=I1QDH4_ORYGL
MAMVASPDDIVKSPLPPPPPPPPPPLPPAHKDKAAYNPYSGRPAHGGDDGLDGIVLVLRAAAALLALVAMALVASCRHGDWMEFTRYQEYRYLLGVAVVASLYSALQAARTFRRMRAGTAYAATFLDFAGDQVGSGVLADNGVVGCSSDHHPNEISGGEHLHGRRRSLHQLRLPCLCRSRLLRLDRRLQALLLLLLRLQLL